MRIDKSHGTLASRKEQIVSYTIEEHKHRFAAWAASRAASVKGCRFSVENGNAFIMASGVTKFVDCPDLLPEIDNFDNEHKKWRKSIIEASKKAGINDLQDGVAAKLINVYLKACLVCGGYHHHEKVKALHPPIDRLLLENLKKAAKVNGWKLEITSKGWSNFNSEDYEQVINEVRRITNLDGKPLWTIEEYWPGHQS